MRPREPGCRTSPASEMCPASTPSRSSPPPPPTGSPSPNPSRGRKDPNPRTGSGRERDNTWDGIRIYRVAAAMPGATPGVRVSKGSPRSAVERSAGAGGPPGRRIRPVRLSSPPSPTSNACASPTDRDRSSWSCPANGQSSPTAGCPLSSTGTACRWRSKTPSIRAPEAAPHGQIDRSINTVMPQKRSAIGPRIRRFNAVRSECASRSYLAFEGFSLALPSRWRGTAHCGPRPGLPMPAMRSPSSGGLSLCMPSSHPSP